MMGRTARIPLCALLLLCLALSGNARAADASSDSWVLRPTEAIGGAVKAVGSAVGSAWASVTSVFAGSDPYEYLPERISDDDKTFFATLEALGLQLSEIKVGGGMFSHSSYRFVASRDPSDVDIQRAERKLEEYRNSAGGLRAGIKQRIVRSILDVAGDRNFILTAVVVELWPWPSVSYEISARNRPPEAGERRIIGATRTQ